MLRIHIQALKALEISELRLQLQPYYGSFVHVHYISYTRPMHASISLNM